MSQLKDYQELGEHLKSRSITEAQVERNMPLLAQLISGQYQEQKVKTQPAHEVDSGVPCLRCGPHCVGGLDLHFWRKLCKNCGCKIEDHGVQVNDTVHQNIVHNLFTATDGSSTLSARKNSAPTPSTQDEKAPEVKKTPRIRSLSTESPTRVAMPPPGRKGRLESDYRRHQMMKQLPPQDFDTHYCHNLTEAEKWALERFSERSRKEAAGKGKVKENTSGEFWMCHGCLKDIPYGAFGVFANKAGPLTCWHPQCFVCSLCKEKLVDHIYFIDHGKIYCGRHYAELYKARCKACDELIFSSEYTEAEGHFWHRRHFVCYTCEQDLGGASYISHKGQPYCLSCYDKQAATKCSTCFLPIKVGTPRISHEGKHWHAYEECFFCRGCNKNLLDSAFLLRDGKVYCSSKCAKHLK